MFGALAVILNSVPLYGLPSLSRRDVGPYPGWTWGHIMDGRRTLCGRVRILLSFLCTRSFIVAQLIYLRPRGRTFQSAATVRLQVVLATWFYVELRAECGYTAKSWAWVILEIEWPMHHHCIPEGASQLPQLWGLCFYIRPVVFCLCRSLACLYRVCSTAAHGVGFRGSQHVRHYGASSAYPTRRAILTWLQKLGCC